MLRNKVELIGGLTFMLCFTIIYCREVKNSFFGPSKCLSYPDTGKSKRDIWSRRDAVERNARSDGMQKGIPDKFAEICFDDWRHDVNVFIIIMTV